MSTTDESESRVGPRREGDDSVRQRGRDREMERKTIRFPKAAVERAEALVADGETLPVVELLTDRGCATGKSGSGRSNSMSVATEALLNKGYPFLIRYESDDYRFLYVRTDVTEAYSGTSKFEAVVRQYREAEPTESKQEEDLYAGNHHVTVRLYDDAAILHFPQSEEYGTIVSVDPNVAQGLAAFTYDCLERIFRKSPQ